MVMAANGRRTSIEGAFDRPSEKRNLAEEEQKKSRQGRSLRSIGRRNYLRQR